MMSNMRGRGERKGIAVLVSGLQAASFVLMKLLCFCLLVLTASSLQQKGSKFVQPIVTKFVGPAVHHSGLRGEGEF
jgi:hypothetical protein